MNRLAEEIRTNLQEAHGLYCRLILVVGPAGSGKTAALLSLAESGGFPYLNLNFLLSQRLLEYPSRARAYRLRDALNEILKVSGDVVVLDNIEILFDPHLKQDPLRLLQLASRNRTIVASWNGEAVGRTLTYATAGHPEHRRYTDVEAILVRAYRQNDGLESERESR